jgi:hypothetical protein
MDIEEARALAYESSAWPLVVAAMTETGVVRDYLLDHAHSKPGSEMAALERRVPWLSLETSLLEMTSYPLNRAHRHSKTSRAWIEALRGVSHDPERDWRSYLCGIAACRTAVELSKAIARPNQQHTLDVDTVYVHGAQIEQDLSHDENMCRCRLRYARGLHIESRSSHLLWAGSGWSCWGPMGLEHDGLVARVSQVIAIARQLGIDPPPRVAPPAPPARR